MPSIWDLIPASAWPVQPFTWSRDPMPSPRWPQETAPPASTALPFGWLHTLAAPTNATQYVDRANPSVHFGSFPDTDIVDPGYTTRLLEDARRAHEFALWMFGPPTPRPAQQAHDIAAEPVGPTSSLATPNATPIAAVDAPRRTILVSGNDDAASRPAPADVRVPTNWAGQSDAPVGNADAMSTQAEGAAQSSELEAATGNRLIERQGTRARAAAAAWGINSPGEPWRQRVANRVRENFGDAFETPIGPGPEYRAAVRPFIVSPSGRINVFNRAALIEAPELADAATRGLGALYYSAIDAGTEGLVSAGFSRGASESLGRDFKALPEAFAGSPGIVRRMVPPPPLRLTGQVHHAISKRVFEALENHRNLRGFYKHRDPRFETKAVDLPAHNGYWGWHEDYDNELKAFIDDHPDLKPKTFESWLHWRYAQPDLKARFPNGL